MNSAQDCPEDTLSFSPESLALIYEFAYSSFQQGHYQQAEDSFRFIALAEPTNPTYWLGVGSALLMQQRYRQAIQPLTMASSLAASDPRPLIYLAECWRELGDMEQIEYTLAQADNRAQNLRTLHALSDAVAAQLELAKLLAKNTNHVSKGTLS